MLRTSARSTLLRDGRMVACVSGQLLCTTGLTFSHVRGSRSRRDLQPVASQLSRIINGGHGGTLPERPAGKRHDLAVSVRAVRVNMAGRRGTHEEKSHSARLTYEYLFPKRQKKPEGKAGPPSTSRILPSPALSLLLSSLPSPSFCYSSPSYT